MPSILITGANRGLGFGLLKLYVDDGWRVYGCCRNPESAAELNAITDASNGALTLHRVDVEDDASIEALKTEIKGQPLDLLLIVAGYYGKVIMTEPGGLQEFGTSDYDDWGKILRVNIMGPMKMAEALVDNVAASDRKQLVAVSSVIGSVGDNTIGNLYAYRSSKAGLNAVMKSMSVNLKDRGITALPLHPGWVRTDMGGPAADLDPQTSVDGMKKVLDGLTPADAGRFLDYTGAELPW
ncbi:MAG: SDR family oxidoreductase [Rhodospirillaceae bacterium]|jgi:NAD(P)-dependent dehydrogenase (short-subunit alcohol dehydrogenase family)|nr:SDR family oxidoreductase [Rhodospirillaceae bacterium]MBT5566427.1 SDR family oxidoreductase [Rhodospirillaceae bacterium]MBT6088271.1 SDR family oxidoreductase [Rhodospirillaceae bacterium]MBT7451793.1 SDR family oxidoreductase [Rhodospirillaceae bacterium]